jgi:hypothetical protein
MLSPVVAKVEAAVRCGGVDDEDAYEFILGGIRPGRNGTFLPDQTTDGADSSPLVAAITAAARTSSGVRSE